MKQFTKDNLKDGVYDGCKIETFDGVFYQVINGGKHLLSLRLLSDPYIDLLDEFIWEYAKKVTDRDGTVLFEREEKRKVTFELTEEQERELRKQLDQ